MESLCEYCKTERFDYQGMGFPCCPTCSAKRVAEALVEIEHAQALLRQACENLCPVDGYVREWEATCKLWQQTQESWQKVSNRRDALKAKLRKPNSPPS